MPALNDIQDLLHDPAQGVQYVGNLFRNQGRVNFCGADSEWTRMRDHADHLLQSRHGLTVSSAYNRMQDMPLLYHWRSAYHRVLQQKPETHAECMTAIDDLRITLQCLEEMHALCPFLGKDQEADPLIKRLREGDIGEGHLGSVAALEHRFIERWNAKGGKKGKPVSKWDAKTYEQTILGRYDILSKRLYPNGESRIAGHYILRDATQFGERGYQLIDMAVDDAAGASDMLAGVMIRSLERETQKRIRNIVTDFH